MLPQPECFTRGCRHLRGATDADERQQLPACLAFPNGIPDDIAYGDNLHLTVDPRQAKGNTVVYEAE